MEKSRRSGRYLDATGLVAVATCVAEACKGTRRPVLASITKPLPAAACAAAALEEEEEEEAGGTYMALSASSQSVMALCEGGRRAGTCLNSFSCCSCCTTCCCCLMLAAAFRRAMGAATPAETGLSLCLRIAPQAEVVPTEHCAGSEPTEHCEAKVYTAWHLVAC